MINVLLPKLLNIYNTIVTKQTPVIIQSDPLTFCMSVLMGKLSFLIALSQKNSAKKRAIGKIYNSFPLL